MNNILSKRFNTLLVAAMCILLLTQCKDEDYTGYSTLTATSPTATLDWTAPASTEEQDIVYPFTITLSEAQVVDVVINVSAHSNSTATEGTDFTVDHSVTIPAFTTTGTGLLTILNDTEPEDTETVAIQIGDERTPNVSFAQQIQSIDLTNFTGSNVNIIFDWAADVEVDGSVVSTCDEVDLDFLLLDPDANVLGYLAASADCPEIADIDGLDDGTYDIAVNLWYNGIHPSDGSTVSFPITSTFTRAGVYDGVPVMQNASTVITSDDLDYYDGGTANVAFIRIVVAGGEPTFFDAVTGDPLF